MTASHSSIAVVEDGLVIDIDGKAVRIHLPMEEKFSIATKLLSQGVVEMRSKKAHEALMSGYTAGVYYAGEEEEKGQ